MATLGFIFLMVISFGFGVCFAAGGMADWIKSGKPLRIGKRVYRAVEVDFPPR
jgi:hypothetical protein